MLWRSLIRKLIAVIFWFLAALFFLTSIYGFSVSKSAVDYTTATFVLLIALILLITGLWILRVPFLRRIAIRLQLVSAPASTSYRRNEETVESIPQRPAEFEPLDRLFATLESYPTYRFSDIQQKWLPNLGGVYVIYDSRGPLYVGRTGNLYRRIKLQHFSGERDYSSFRHLLMDRLSITEEEELTNYLKSCFFRFIILADESQQKDLEHYVKIRLKPLINN